MTRKSAVISFGVDAAALGAALGRIGKIADGKDQGIPIVRHVMLHARDGMLEIDGTDREQWVRLKVDADVTAGGKLTLPTRELVSFVKGLPSGAMLTVEHKSGPGARAELSAGRKISAKLDTLDPADFPTIPEIAETAARFILAPDLWLSMSAQVAHCMDADEVTRMYLRGASLSAPLVNGHGVRELRLVATDGRQLARLTADAPLGVDTLEPCIIPRDAVNALRAVLAGEKELVEFAVSDRMIHLTAPRLVYASCLLEGVYPEVDRVIPQATDPVLLPVKLLDAALARAQMFAEQDKMAGRLIALDIKADGITITAGPAFDPRYTETVEAPIAVKRDIRVGMSLPQLRSILALAKGPDIEIDAPDEATPVRLTDPMNAGAVFVTMPTRV